LVDRTEQAFTSEYAVLRGSLNVEEREKEMTAPNAHTPLDEQALNELCRRYDDTSNAETRTRNQMLLLSSTGQTSTQIREAREPGQYSWVVAQWQMHGFSQ
jgi:hypothetical protein